MIGSQIISGIFLLATLSSAGLVRRDGNGRYLPRSVPLSNTTQTSESTSSSSDTDILTIIPVPETTSSTITTSTSSLSSSSSNHVSFSTTSSDKTSTTSFSSTHTSTSSTASAGSSLSPGAADPASTIQTLPSISSSRLSPTESATTSTKAASNTRTTSTSTNRGGEQPAVSGGPGNRASQSGNSPPPSSSNFPTLNISSSAAGDAQPKTGSSTTSQISVITSNSASPLSKPTSVSVPFFSLNNTSSVILPTPGPSSTSLAASAGFQSGDGGDSTTVIVINLSTLTNSKPSLASSTNIPLITSLPPLTISKAPTVIPSAPPATGTISPAVYAANLAEAEGYNDLFATLNFSSPCTGGELACIAGNVGSCDSQGSFQIVQVCGSNAGCFALPLTSTRGVYVGCAGNAFAASELGLTLSSTTTVASFSTSISSPGSSLPEFASETTLSVSGFLPPPSSAAPPTSSIPPPAAPSPPTTSSLPPIGTVTETVHKSSILTTTIQIPAPSPSAPAPVAQPPAPPQPIITLTPSPTTIVIGSGGGDPGSAVLTIIPVPQPTGDSEKETVTETVTVTVTERIP